MKTPQSKGLGRGVRPAYVPKTTPKGKDNLDNYSNTNQAKVPEHPWFGPLPATLDHIRQDVALLDDQQIKFFLYKGYLVLKTQLPYNFHQNIYDHLESHPELSGGGNNVLPLIPSLNQVYEDPFVKGALTSLLGPSYIMHPHRACHLTPPGKTSQKWHRDTFWGYGRNIRYNKIRYVMAMYYPQKTTLEMGPTSMKPGTQYYSIDPKYYKGDLLNHFDKDVEAKDFMGVVDAGQVILIHYDIIHKGSSNRSNKNRYMFKFQFLRMEEPTEPLWKCLDVKWEAKDYQQDHSLEPICRSIWRWLCGRGEDPPPSSLTEQELHNMIQMMDDRQEWNRFYAVFCLSEAGYYDILMDRLKNKDLQMKLNATYALACASSPAKLVGSLRKCLQGRGAADFCQSILYILGQFGRDAAIALDDIVPFLKDSNANTRFYACEALGIIGSTSNVSSEFVVHLADALQDQEGKVRFQAALSLAQLGPKAEVAVPHLFAALSDCNRYTQGYAVIALRRIGTPLALGLLMDFLMASRYCPLTTPSIPF